MKKLFLLTAIFFSLLNFAQMQRSLVILSPEGKYFNLYINNVPVNNQAAYKVQVKGLTDNYYNVKVVFTQNGYVIQDNLYLPPLSEISYELVSVSPQHYAFELNEVIPLETDSGNLSQTFDWGNISSGSPGNINIQIINQNNNLNNNQINNTVVNPPQGEIIEEVYVDGYEGDIGCQPPVSSDRFQSMLNTIENQDFDETKLQIAKQIISSNCMVVSQLVEILQIFDFDDVKLDLAKFAFDYIYDLENYYLVNNVLTFDTDKEDLNKFIMNKGY